VRRVSGASAKKPKRARQAAVEAEPVAAKRCAEAQRARRPWTSQRALERYRTLCETFDDIAELASQAFEDTPWPTLRTPFTFEPEDINWTAVETFFHTVGTCAHRTTVCLSKSCTGDSIQIDGAYGACSLR
jgi:hypothetical protein